MAARKNKILHAEKTKDLIRASQLLNRLNSFAVGKIEMSRAQVAAAEIVIRKVVPDLKAVELTGNGPNNEIVQKIVVEIVDPSG
jgi:hypothetical protein